MISVAILGASGRMGSLTRELVDADPNLKLHAALGSGSDLSMMLGADVVVDFTLPDVSPKMVSLCNRKRSEDCGWHLWLVRGQIGWC